jgi:uncharacterized protein
MSVVPTEPQQPQSPQSDSVTPATPPAASGGPRWLRREPDAIGWGLLLFVVFFVAIGALLRVLILHLPGLPRSDSAAGLVLAESGLLFTTLAATAILARLEGKSVLDYGLRDSQWLRRFGMGAVWGFVLISALVGLLDVTGHLSFDGRLLSGSTIVFDALGLGVGFLLVGFAEELLLRGYLQATLARGIGFWPAAIILSIGFGAAHGSNSGEATIGLISAGTFGLVACYALRRTGSLAWPIGAHAAWDWGQSYFYGVPDSGGMFPGHLMATHAMGAPWLSGGTVGPEGSIFVLLVFGAMVPIIALTTPRRQAPRALADISQ